LATNGINLLTSKKRISGVLKAIFNKNFVKLFIVTFILQKGFYLFFDAETQFFPKTGSNASL
jgi:hypothetical protein